MKNFYLLFAFNALLAANSFSQSLSPTAVSTSGGFSSNSSAMLSSTIGEMTMVTTLNGANNILTQGFQQPTDFDVSVSEIHQGSLSIKLFPNPATEQISLNITSDKSISLQFSMLDMVGRKVYSSTVTTSPIGLVHNIDVSNFSSGVYLLNIESSDKKFSKTIRFIKN